MNTVNNMVTITFTASDMDEFVNENATVNITDFTWTKYANKPSIDYEIQINSDWTTTIDAREYGMVSQDTYNNLSQTLDLLTQEFNEIVLKYNKLLQDNTTSIGEKLKLSIELEQLKNTKKKKFLGIF